MDRRVKERLIGATILVVLIVLVVPEMLSGPKGRATSPAPAPTTGGSEPVRNVTVDLATSRATPAADAPAASAATVSTGNSEAAAAAADPTASSASESETSAPVSASPPGITHAAPPTIATLRAQEAAPPALENAPTAPRSPTNGAKSAAAVEPAAAAAAATATASAADATRHGWAVQLGSFASRANADKLVRKVRAYSASVYVSASGKGRALRYRVRVGPLNDRPAAERTLAKLKQEGLSASLVSP